MKNFVLFTTLALVASFAQAATTGTLLLKGVVISTVSLTVTPESIASALPLNITQNRTKVGSVHEESNSGRGYKVSITSTNGGKMVHESQANSSLSYRMLYNNQNVNLQSGQTFSYSDPRVNTDRDLRISYSGNGALADGSYSDTLTFTIAAN